MSRSAHLSRRTARLTLDRLESRLTPAGNVTASVSAGVLTLTGDEDSNGIVLLHAGTTVEVGPTGTTTINGVNAAIAFSNVTAIKTFMKGGNDEVSIGPLGPFTFAGATTFDLGDGANTLDLSTSDVLSLGSLTVKAGDGQDTIKLNGAAGSEVTGSASLTLGAGGVNVQLTNVAIRGLGGLKVTATDGNDLVTLTTVQIDKQFNVSAGNGSLGVIATGSTLGGVALSGGGSSPSLSDQGVIAELISTPVTGAVTLMSKEGADLTIAGGQSGNVSVTAGPLAQGRLAFLGTTTVNGGVTVKGLDTQLTLNSGSTVAVTTDVAVLGTRFGQVDVSGSNLQARGIRVTGSLPLGAPGGPVTISNSAVTVANDISVKGARADFVIDNSSVMARTIALTGTESAAFRPPAAPSGPASLSLSGSLTVNAPEATFLLADGTVVATGNVKVTGTRDTTFNIPAGNAPTLSVTGALTVQGGSGVLGFVVADGSLTVGTDLTVKGEALDKVQLTPTATSQIGRNLSVTLGQTDDQVEVNAKVQVTANLTVNAGAGNNVVLLGAPVGPAGPTVGKNLSITTLGGNDVVTLNQVTVTGTTTIKTGAGADALAIRGPSAFTGATTIDLGAGDDNLAVANDPGSTTGPVSFTGTVNAQLGVGNDTLQLGLAPGSGGNATTTTVAFSTSTANKIDGGAGLNFFDDEAALFTGTVKITTTFTDPTP